jgi:3-oxoacyl-[acyl-carrier-protein] synthase III
MRTSENVGIYGIGVYLPEIVRTNDWWPEEIVAKWKERVTGKLDRPADHSDELATEGGRLVLEAMAELRDDPFKGSRERRIMPEGMLTSHMELAAARDAIARANVDPQQIDLVLSTTSLPDYLMVPNACRTHDALGLNKRCFALQTEGVCNAFHMQLTLAESMIKAGQARVALLIQSSGTSRLMRREDPMSAWFGDGATAVIVGRVASGYGVLGRCHEADGSYYEGLVCGIPNRRWYEGAPYAYIVLPHLSRKLLLETLHRSRVLIHDAIKEAGLQLADIDFYAAHQGFAWLRKVTQKLAGIDHAQTLDTFPMTASILGANIPLILALAEREGLLRSGDDIATFGGAAGAILSSFVVRWGRE